MKDNKNLQRLRDMQTNKLCYVCSPYKGDIERNVKYAQDLVKDLIIDGLNPLASHLYHTNFLDDNDLEQRKIGMDLGLDWIYYCRYIKIGDDFGISSGMQSEIKLANKLKLIKI